MANRDRGGDFGIYAVLREKLAALYEHDQYAIHEKVLSLHIHLTSKYPNAREYQLFHLISGSTPKQWNGAMDFPPPDSVKEFILREYAAAFPGR
jgi:hypothetical protein